MLSISGNASPSSQGSIQEISFLEKQHLSYLRKVTHNENVSFRMTLPNARAEILNRYDSHFIENITALDLETEVQEFNRAAAYKHLHFIDWFALRDYKEDGYVRINFALRHSHLDVIKKDPGVSQLMLSLMHLALMQSNDFGNDNIELFRGDVRPLDIVQQWEEGDIFTSDSFLSTSGDEDVASSFCGDADSEENQVNVMYEIYNDNPFSGANITEVLNDGEDEFLFLPKTKFVITDTEFDEEAKQMTVKLSTCYSSEDEFDSLLHSLIFPTNS